MLFRSYHVIQCEKLVAILNISSGRVYLSRTSSILTGIEFGYKGTMVQQNQEYLDQNVNMRHGK